MKNNLKLCARCAQFFKSAYEIRRADPREEPAIQVCDHCEQEDYCATYEIGRDKR